MCLAKLLGDIALTAIFLLLLSPTARSTSIVSIIGDKWITIAADGLGAGPLITGKPGTIPVCKILCIHLMCFGAAGVYWDAAVAFDLYKLAEAELLRGGVPPIAAYRLKEQLESVVPRIVKVSNNASTQYVEWLKGTPVISYFFSGFDTFGEALISGGDAKIDVNGSARPIQIFFAQGKPLINTLWTGSNQTLSDFVNKNPMWRSSAAANSSEFAEGMVRAEMAASKKAGKHDIGEPITVITLTESGVRFEKKGACEEKLIKN